METMDSQNTNYYTLHLNKKMKPIFTIHAGEYLVAAEIEKTMNYPGAEPRGIEGK